jgi:putative ABC transport system permease protein
LGTHRLRSALTMMGIIIGVAAVILLSAIGNGAQSSINTKLQPLFTRVTVVPSVGPVAGGAAPKELVDDDVTALQDQVPDVATAIPITDGQALAETETTEFRSHVIGSTEDWLQVQDRDVQVGSFFEESQVRSTAKVVVVGAYMARVLFGDAKAAVGRTIWINHQSFEVIGVMLSIGQPFDNDAVIPLTTARRYIFGGRKLTEITVQANQARAVPAIEDQVIRVLSQRHQIQDPADRDFEVYSLRGPLNKLNDIMRLATLFATAVATISLFIGGIGIMNIMLVSVTERVHEIGIRRAIGATRRAIFQQFLMESLMLAGVGGLIGILVGVGLSVLGAIIVPTFGYIVGTIFIPKVTISSVVLSFTVSLAIGLVSGLCPAKRASRLRPIEAIRYK